MYQPRESGDHSKRWTRIGDGVARRASIGGRMDVEGRVVRKSVREEEGWLVGIGVDGSVWREGRREELLEGGEEEVRSWEDGVGNLGERVLMMVRRVLRGRSGSQEFSQSVLGLKPDRETCVAGLASDVVLFWRENVGAPAGSLPRAFSDKPRSCIGTWSSDVMDGVRELLAEVVDCDGVGLSSSSESDESPMAKVSSSTGACCPEAVRLEAVDGVGLARGLLISARLQRASLLATQNR
jgi:hypothetical protein